MVIYIVFFLRQTPQRCWKLIVVVNGMVDLTLRTGRTSVPFIYFTFSQRTFHFERSERSWKPKNSEPRCKCDKMVNGTREFQRLPFQKFSFSPKISSSLKWKIVSIFILTEISGNFSKWKTKLYVWCLFTGSHKCYRHELLGFKLPHSFLSLGEFPFDKLIDPRFIQYLTFHNNFTRRGFRFH